MQLRTIAATMALLLCNLAYAQKNSTLCVIPLDHETPNNLAEFSTQRATDSLKANGSWTMIYAASYPKILLKSDEGQVLVEIPYDEDIEKPAQGLQRTLRIEKRQLNKEGSPELVFHWENCVSNNFCYKGLKVIDIDSYECILDQVTFKSMETPIDSNDLSKKPQKIQYKRGVKLGIGEITIEDVTAIKPDEVSEDGSEELAETPTGCYKLTAKNKFVWNKLATKPTTTKGLASRKFAKQGKKEEL